MVVIHWHAQLEILFLMLVSAIELNLIDFISLIIRIFCCLYWKVIDDEKLQENCSNVGTYFLEELEKLRNEFEIIGDVRGKGLMIGIEMVENKVSEFIELY